MDEEKFGVIKSIDPETGEEVNSRVVQNAGVAFDPATQRLDLTMEEKRRTTALMLAIQAYKNLLIPDAAYLREATENARRGDGPKIQPATMDAMVVSAIKFDHFIATGKAIRIKEDDSIIEPEDGKPALTQE